MPISTYFCPREVQKRPWELLKVLVFIFHPTEAQKRPREIILSLFYYYFPQKSYDALINIQFTFYTLLHAKTAKDLS